MTTVKTIKISEPAFPTTNSRAAFECPRRVVRHCRAPLLFRFTGPARCSSFDDFDGLRTYLLKKNTSRLDVDLSVTTALSTTDSRHWGKIKRMRRGFDPNHSS